MNCEHCKIELNDSEIESRFNRDWHFNDVYNALCDGCQCSLPDYILDTYNETTCAKCDMPYLIERDDDDCPHDKDYRKLINLQKLFNISDDEIRQVVDNFDRLNKLKAFL